MHNIVILDNVDSANIIGDVAGNYETLLALLAKMPEGLPISVGDMVDRGPRSKEVLGFFQNDGLAILGNHEHMMYDYVLNRSIYGRGDWQYNGGHATLDSFHDRKKDTYPGLEFWCEWLTTLPIAIELHLNGQTSALITHGPINPVLGYKKACEIPRSSYNLLFEDTVLWNRGSPKRIKDFMQIFGHNSPIGLKEFKDKKGAFAYCIDSSRSKVLTGIHWPSMVVYQQENID